MNYCHKNDRKDQAWLLITSLIIKFKIIAFFYFITNPHPFQFNDNKTLYKIMGLALQNNNGKTTNSFKT